MARLILRTMPDQLRYWFLGKVSRLNTKIEPRRPLAPELRVRLTAEFAPEVERLSGLLGRDLSAWSTT